MNYQNITFGGGRISSPQHREIDNQILDFAGLETNVNRYDLLLLVKKIGKFAGFSARMIELLDYYMAYTRDCDWEEGSNPIVYQSTARTAMDLGYTERQLNRIENDLFKVGALSWNDSGNHKRYGQRDPETGQILFAYGVDLTPLAYLKTELENKLFEKQMRDKTWFDCKKAISAYRSKICSILREFEVDRYNDPAFLELSQSYKDIAKRIRTSMELETLLELRAEHETLYKKAISFANNNTMSQKMSGKDDKNVRHINNTTHKKSIKIDTSRASPNCFQEISRKPKTVNKKEGAPDTETKDNLAIAAGLDRVTLKQILNIASEEIRNLLPIVAGQPMNWNDFVEAAYKRKSKLGISQNIWGEACLTLGKNGAAICLILTDLAASREVDPVLRPGGYFTAMINRAKEKKLNLHASIFAHLKKDNSVGEIS